MIARELCRRASPKTFMHNAVADNRNYADLLKETMEYVNCGGIRAILTPGRYNAAYFEHSYLAERSGAALASCSDLFVEDNVCITGISGQKTEGRRLVRRISDEYLDPLTFLPEVPDRRAQSDQRLPGGECGHRKRAGETASATTRAFITLCRR